jgi:hypothetical protein
VHGAFAELSSRTHPCAYRPVDTRNERNTTLVKKHLHSYEFKNVAVEPAFRGTDNESGFNTHGAALGEREAWR